MDSNKEPSFQLLSDPTFVPELYIRTISQNYVGGSELLSLKKRIQALADETSNSLKKNVYQNYVQFIETAKEISHLESEMYQLSHLLSEQKSLLSALSTTSILEDHTHFTIETSEKLNDQDIEEENKQKLGTILEKVEGCKEVLDVPNRSFVFEGDLLEIDATENTAIKFVHVYLFNDSLMVANRNPNSRGPMRYAFEHLYELSSLAVVNVRDLGNIKHAFKLLIFPDTRVFQCSSNANKKEWLDKIDQAKKFKLTVEQQKRESVIVEKPAPTRPASIVEDTPITHPDWFLDIPDELDVCIAQRQFEDAVNHLNRAQKYVATCSSDHTLKDVESKADQKRNILIEMLMNELEVNPEKSLRGGLRATRTAVRLLNRLGRSAQACDLFLKLCSATLRIQCKRVKREGSATAYVRHLAGVVFTNMCHMSEEFLRAFPPDSSACASTYVVWASTELSQFASHFAKQVFVPQTDLSTITECVVLVRAECDRLCSYGVDFRYQLDGTLRSALTKALNDQRDKVIDSIKVRVSEDKWIPMNLGTRSALARCLQEHAAIGLKLDPYVTGDVWLHLSSSTVAFSKAFLTLLDDCLRLKTTELLHPINETLWRTFEAQLRYLDHVLKSDAINHEQKQFVCKNGDFLLTVVADAVQGKYREVVGFECAPLNKLVKTEHSSGLFSTAASSRNTKTKYSSEFL